MPVWIKSAQALLQMQNFYVRHLAKAYHMLFAKYIHSMASTFTIK